jgi:hypothetical protein
MVSPNLSNNYNNTQFNDFISIINRNINVIIVKIIIIIIILIVILVIVVIVVVIVIIAIIPRPPVGQLTTCYPNHQNQ